MSEKKSEERRKLLESFAAAALAGLLANPYLKGRHEESAEQALRYAEALLARLEARK